MIELRIERDHELRTLARGRACWAFVVKEDGQVLPFVDYDEDNNEDWERFLRICEHVHRLTGKLLEVGRK